MSESAFNDAMGAILTFTLLALATGSEKFSLGDAAFDLFEAIRDRHSGRHRARGYLAALLIAA